MSISFLVLAISTISLTYLATLNMQTTHFNDLQSIADITVVNSEAALVFSDAEAAKENLSSLRFKPFIVTGVLVDNKGRELAKYTRADAPDLPTSNLNNAQAVAKFGFHQVSREIENDGNLIGNLYIISDFREIESTNQAITIAAALILGACLLLVYILSYSFQKVITEPLKTIISAARTRLL